MAEQTSDGFLVLGSGDQAAAAQSPGPSSPGSYGTKSGAGGVSGELTSDGYLVLDTSGKEAASQEAVKGLDLRGLTGTQSESRRGPGSHSSGSRESASRNNDNSSTTGGQEKTNNLSQNHRLTGGTNRTDTDSRGNQSQSHRMNGVGSVGQSGTGTSRRAGNQGSAGTQLPESHVEDENTRAIRSQIADLDAQDKTYWSDWDWQNYWGLQSDLKKAETPARRENWEGALRNYSSHQNTAKELNELSIKQELGGLTPQEQQRYGNLLTAYTGERNAYDRRQQAYTADNVGDWIDRAFYLSAKPGTEWTEEERADAAAMIDVLEPKTPLQLAMGKGNGNYYNQLFKENKSEAFIVQNVVNNLKARQQDGQAGSSFGQGFFRGAGLASINQAGAASLAKNAPGSVLSDVLNYAQGGLQLGEAEAQKNSAYGIGSFTGNVALLHGIGALTGPLVGAVSKFAPAAAEGIARAMIGGGTTLGINSAIQNAGARAAGQMTGGEYAADILTSGFAGVVGGGLSGAVRALQNLPWKAVASNVATKELIYNTLADSPLATALLAGLSGAAFAGGDTAVREMSKALNYGENYAPDYKEILKSAAINFAFGTIEAAIDLAMPREATGTGEQGSTTPTEKPMTTDYFNPDMTASEMKAKYRDLVKQYHPDRNPAGAEIMQKINAEYDHWYRNGLQKTAQAGETARADAAAAESRGDTKAATEAEGRMQEAIRELNAYVEDNTQISSEVREAVGILNSVTGDHTDTQNITTDANTRNGTAEPERTRQEGTENNRLTPEETVAMEGEKLAAGRSDYTVSARTPEIRQGNLQQAEAIGEVAKLHAPLQQEIKAAERQETAQKMLDTGSDPVSMRELGADTTADMQRLHNSKGQVLTILPQATWDTEMQLVNAWSQEATGLPITYVQGDMTLYDDSRRSNQTVHVDAAYSRDGIVIRADNDRRTVTQIFEEDILGGLQRGERNGEETKQAVSGILGQTTPAQSTGEEGVTARTADEIRKGSYAGTEAAVDTAGQTAAGGSGGRISDRRAGGSNEELVPDAGAGNGRAIRSGAGNSADRARDAVWKGRAKKLSAADYGIQGGTKNRTFYEIPEQYESQEQKALKQDIEDLTGCEVTFISGPIEIIGSDNRAHNVNGFFDPETKRIVVRTDHRSWSQEQIGLHETYHALSEINPGLTEDIRERIIQEHSREELERIVKAYIVHRRGINDVETNSDVRSTEAIQILDEIFADAYGDMDPFGTGITKMAETVDRAVNDNLGGQIEPGGENARGPPQYAYAGETDEGPLDQKQIQDIQSIGRKSLNTLTPQEIESLEPIAKRYLAEMGPKSPFFRAWFGDWRANDQTPVLVADQQGDARGLQHNDDTGWDINVSRKVFDETQTHKSAISKAARAYLPYIDDIVRKAVLLDSWGIGNKKSPNSLLMHSLYAVADIGNGPEVLKLYVEEMSNPNSSKTNKRAYQLQDIQVNRTGVVGSQKSASLITQPGTVRTIADLFGAVKSMDPDFNPEPASTIIDEDGRPLVVYHGTDDDFTVFDRSKGRSNMDIQGMFFSPWQEDAEGYGGRVGVYYLNIKNPAPEGLGYKALNRFKGQNGAGIKAREYLESLGYDGVNNSDEEYIAFYPEQIKSATDNIGTYDKKNPDIRFSYAGEMAWTADQGLMDTALSLEEEGVDNESIRQQTGWFRGMDGKWRFEIDDSDMKLKPITEELLAKQHTWQGLTLEDLIEHNKLFEAYPLIKNVDVAFDISRDSRNDGTWDTRNHISLNERLAEPGKEEELLDTLIHEIQHTIQTQEEFSPGASTEYWNRKIKEGYDSRRPEDVRRSMQRQQEAEEKLQRIRENDPEYYRDMMALIDSTPTSARGEVDWDTLEQLEEDPPEWQAFDAERDRLEEKYGDRVYEFINLAYEREATGAGKRSAFDLYLDTAGEIEARDTSIRRPYNREQRLNRAPSLGDENTVFSDYGTRGMSSRSEEPVNLSDVTVPTREELEAKGNIPVVDIRETGEGTYREMRAAFQGDENTKALYEKPVSNKDTRALLFINPNTASHSFSNPGKENISMMKHMREIAENAILTHKEDSRSSQRDNTTGVYKFFGAVNTEDGVRPVKLTVKEYNIVGQSLPNNVVNYLRSEPGRKTYANVYDGKVLVLEDIEKETSSSAASPSANAELDNHPSASEISVAELLNLVKGEDTKYIPQSKASGMQQFSVDEDHAAEYNEAISSAMEERHWPENFPKVTVHTNMQGLRGRNPELWEKAKHGDREAADKLVDSFVKEDKLRKFAEQYHDALVIPVRKSPEVEGANQIPYSLALKLESYGMKIDDNIVQIRKATHTDADMWSRMASHAAFDGDVIPGGHYVLIDDAVAGGGTLNDLRKYIESKGGIVDACMAGAATQGGSYLAIRPELVEQIHEKFGPEIDDILRKEGIAYDAASLTDRQGRFLIRQDPDTIRNRSAAGSTPQGYRGNAEDSGTQETGERGTEQDLKFSLGDEDEDLDLFDDGIESDVIPEETGITKALYGRQDTTYSGNEPVDFTYAIVPLESLVISNEPDGTINPAYPQELQPRDRTRADSLRQTMSIANNLIPRKLEESAEVQNGAPLIRSDGVVISGNGRSMALQMAYQKDGLSDEYRNYLSDNRGKWGIQDTELPEHPVLVRVAADGIDWRKLSQEANVSTVAGKSASEQARVDAGNLLRHPEILDKLIPNDEGNLNTRDNRDFISDFVHLVIPEAEQNMASTSAGLLTQDGLSRMENAIFEAAYGDASLLERMSESLDDDMKRVTNALLAAAPKVVSYESLVDAGNRYDLKMRDRIVEAVQIYTEAKSKRQTVAELTSTEGMLDEHNDQAVYLARFIERNKGSGKQLRTMLGNLYDEADELGDPNQAGFFDMEEDQEHGFDEILEGAIKRYERASGRQLPKPERWGKGSLEEISETRGLSGKELDDYYLTDERGMDARPDAGDTGEPEQETGSLWAGAAESPAEDGRGGSDLGRDRGTIEPETLVAGGEAETISTPEVTPAEELSPGARRILADKRKQERREKAARKRNEQRRLLDYPAMEADTGPSAREIVNRIREQASAEKKRVLEQVRKKDFNGTEPMKKLGIRIDAGMGNYKGTKQLRDNERAAYSLKQTIRNRERQLNITSREKTFANGIAAGLYTEDEIPATMNREAVREMADLYWMERSIDSDLVLQRRRDINAQLDQQIRTLLPDDPGYKVPPMVVLNHRTPERVCRNIYGDEKGQEVYEQIFHPVSVNEAERLRFVNRMFDDVREIEGTDGRKSELTRAEAALAQQVLEGRAAAELVAGMELEDGRQRIIDTAENILGGEEASDAAREMGLSDQERGIAEQYSRWLQTKAILDSGEFDTVKIDNAVKLYQEKYDLFYDAINDFLVAHGYKPIGFIKGYAPHMQMDADLNVFAKYLQQLGINTDVTRLPANIAGKTADLKPNKRWNPYFLSRTGDLTDFDIVKGYQSYVEYLSDVLYHTDDIMRVRALSRYYRELGAPEEIKENLSWARHMNETSPEVKQEELEARGILNRDAALSDEEINERFDAWIQEQFDNIKNTTKYSDLAMYLDNYANILAGKQSMADRGGEYGWGRESLTKANRLASAFARTQVAGNLSSALTQTSQLPIIQAEVGTKYYLQALRDWASGKLKRDGWALKSDHLTERAGTNALVTGTFEMLINNAFTPLRWVDGFTATIAVRSKYLQQIAEGKTPEQAMHAADRFARRVQSTRAKGSVPLAFKSKNFFSQALHMFQLEVSNSWEHIVQDLPYDFRQIEKEHGKDKAILALAKVLLSYLTAAFLLNRTVEEISGGTPAPADLLSLTANFIASGYGLRTNAWLETIMDNVLEGLGGGRVFGTDRSDMREEFDWGQAAEDTFYEITSDLPYIRNIMGILGLGDQTLPIPFMGMGQDLKYLWSDAKADIENGQLTGQTAMDLLRVMNQINPFGRQMTKSAEGLYTMAQGGRYINGKLYYPVENTFGNWVKATLFGKGALAENDAFYSGDDTKLSLGATELYQILTEDGADRFEAYEALQEGRTLSQEQKDFLQKYAEESGGDSFALYQTMQEYKEASADKTLGSYEKGRQERKAITDATGLSDQERLDLYRVMSSNNDGKAEKLEAMMHSGLSWEEAVRCYDEYAAIEANEDLTKKEKAEQWAAWTNREEITDAQKETVREQLMFWQSIPIDETTVDKFASAGMTPDKAEMLADLINNLTPNEGFDHVTDLQKYQAIVETDLTENEQWDAIRAITPESYTSTHEKITVMQDMGIRPDVWTQSKQAMYDADDANNNNGSVDQKEAKAALDGMNIPDEQKAILWQLTNKSWSWKNNPYDTDIGQEVYGLMHDGDTGSSSTKKKKSGGGRRRGGGRRYRGGGKSYGPAEILSLTSGTSWNYSNLLEKWKKKRYSRAQILAAVEAGLITEEEAEQILSTPQEDDTDGSLNLGEAEAS